MKPTVRIMLVVAIATLYAHGHISGQAVTNPQNTGQQPQGAINTKPTNPVIPPGTPDRFNEGLFTAKEQFHDQQITDLLGRVISLEGRSNFLSGAIWALSILIVFFIAILKAFWKGIAKVILAEIGSPVIAP